MSHSSRKRARINRIKYNIIMWILVIAAVCAVSVFLVTNYYEDTKRKLEEMNYPCEYIDLVETAAEKYELNPALIFAIIRTESSFNPDAESSVGACGIMQIMPSSFEWLQTKRGEEGKYTEKDLFNPEISIDYGSYLLKFFYDYYGTERSAIAAYNAGFVVGDWLEDIQYSADGKNLDEIPYPETANYVVKVENAKKMYSRLYYTQNNYENGKEDN